MDKEIDRLKDFLLFSGLLSALISEDRRSAVLEVRFRSLEPRLKMMEGILRMDETRVLGFASAGAGAGLEGVVSGEVSEEAVVEVGDIVVVLGFGVAVERLEVEGEGSGVLLRRLEGRVDIHLGSGRGGGVVGPSVFSVVAAGGTVVFTDDDDVVDVGGDESAMTSRSKTQYPQTGGSMSIIPCGSSVQGGGFSGTCFLAHQPLYHFPFSHLMPSRHSPPHSGGETVR
ncbi:MAG: hypothetical protein Q9166_007035 [cf. Caloplaca sp. 2 TL-2023]